MEVAESKLQIRRVVFRIYPNVRQEATMIEWCRIHCELYNAGIQERRDAWERCGKRVDYVSQANQLPAIISLRPELSVLGSHARQATLRRVDRAFLDYFDRVKACKAGTGKRKPGYPRFKASARFRGWTYPDHSGWKLVQTTPGKHGFLEITNLGKLRIRGRARTWGKDSTLTITRKGNEWFASVTVSCQPVRECGREAFAFDWGLENFITLSTGEVIESFRHLRTVEDKLKQAQRDFDRKDGPNRRNANRLPSKGWLRQRALIRRLNQEVTNCRRNSHHLESAKLVKRAALLVTESLNILGLSASAKGTVAAPGKNVKQKAGLNRAILDSAPGEFLSKLTYKAAEAGCQLVWIEPREWKPSQTCPGCGNQVKKPLDRRVHHCLECDLQATRDHASAIVMLNVALTGKAWESGLRGANLLPPGRGRRRRGTTPNP